MKDEIRYNELQVGHGAVALFSSSGDVGMACVAELQRPVVMPCQTHTVNVVNVIDGSENLSDVDALITRRRDIAVGVRTADCVPIVIYAPDIEAVAAIHAGWRGTIGGIVDNVVGWLKRLGGRADEMMVAFGPSICGDCYEVDEVLAARFEAEGYRECVSRRGVGDKPHVDLQQVNIVRLEALGVKCYNINSSMLCTRHSVGSDGESLFPSWRREPGITDRLVTLIYLK